MLTCGSSFYANVSRIITITNKKFLLQFAFIIQYATIYILQILIYEHTVLLIQYGFTVTKIGILSHVDKLEIIEFFRQDCN